MLCVLTCQVPAKLLGKNFSVTSCIIGIWATNGILSAGAGSSFFHALCGITADDAMLVIVHHRTTSLRCLQRVLPACWEKSRESWLRTESVTSLKCLCQKMKSSDRSTAKDCKRMVWIPLKSSDSIHWGRTIEQGRETNK